jgi:hypothetical protein
LKATIKQLLSHKKLICEHQYGANFELFNSLEKNRFLKRDAHYRVNIFNVKHFVTFFILFLGFLSHKNPLIL